MRRGRGGLVLFVGGMVGMLTDGCGGSGTVTGTVSSGASMSSSSSSSPSPGSPETPAETDITSTDEAVSSSSSAAESTQEASPTSSEPPAESSEAPTEGDGGGEAPAGDYFEGDATYYTPGLGSCGIESTEQEFVAALSKILFDADDNGNSNNNPNCKRKIFVKKPGGAKMRRRSGEDSLDEGITSGINGTTTSGGLWPGSVYDKSTGYFRSTVVSRNCSQFGEAVRQPEARRILKPRRLSPVERRRNQVQDHNQNRPDSIPALEASRVKLTGATPTAPSD